GPVHFRRRARTRGFPPSGNGASSFHLGWRLPPGAVHLVSASGTLEVLTPPVVDHLYFWALQVSFPGAGAAHLGLQWNDRHPGFGAVNWGGYAADGSLLPGTESPLPSTPADPNTRDSPSKPRRPYRLRVPPVDAGERARARTRRRERRAAGHEHRPGHPAGRGPRNYPGHALTSPTVHLRALAVLALATAAVIALGTPASAGENMHVEINKVVVGSAPAGT